MISLFHESRAAVRHGLMPPLHLLAVIYQPSAQQSGYFMPHRAFIGQISLRAISHLSQLAISFSIPRHELQGFIRPGFH